MERSTGAWYGDWQSRAGGQKGTAVRWESDTFCFLSLSFSPSPPPPLSLHILLIPTYPVFSPGLFRRSLFHLVTENTSVFIIHKFPPVSDVS